MYLYWAARGDGSGQEPYFLCKDKDHKPHLKTKLCSIVSTMKLIKFRKKSILDLVIVNITFYVLWRNESIWGPKQKLLQDFNSRTARRSH